MNILVTGCNGLIGSHLTEFLLKKSISVVGLDVNPTHQVLRRYSNFVFNQGSFDDISLLTGIIEKYKIEKIIHCGGISHPKGFENNPKKIIDTNIVGTFNVFEAGRVSKIDQIIYLSSAAVYGESKSTSLNEDTLLRPTSIYGVSKVAGEYLAKIYFEQYGINTITLRLPFVYGPGRVFHDPIKYLLEKALNGEDIIEDTGIDQELEYIYVKDVVKAIWLTLNSSKINGLTLNIGTGYLTSTKKIVSILKELFPNTKFKLGPGGFGYDESSPLDCSKAKELLNFKPSYSIVEGIHEYYNSLTH